MSNMYSEDGRQKVGIWNHWVWLCI